MPLEDQGGEGIAGNHWEKVTLGYEAMTAMTSKFSSFSNFTLVFLQATGWYISNLTVAEPFAWGYLEGCGFTNVNSTELSGTWEFCLPESSFTGL